MLFLVSLGVLMLLTISPFLEQESRAGVYTDGGECAYTMQGIDLNVIHDGDTALTIDSLVVALQSLMPKRACMFLYFDRVMELHRAAGYGVDSARYFGAVARGLFNAFMYDKEGIDSIAFFLNTCRTLAEQSLDTATLATNMVLRSEIVHSIENERWPDSATASVGFWTDADSSRQLLARAIDLYHAVGDRKAEAETRLHLSARMDWELELEDLMEQNELALAILEELGDTSALERSYISLGHRAHYLGPLETALVYYRKAISLRDDVNHYHRLAAAICDSGDVELALQTCYAGLKKAIKRWGAHYAVSLAQEMGFNFEMREKREAALSLYNYADSLNVADTVDYTRSLELSGKARCFTGLGLHDSAWYYIEQAYAADRAEGDTTGWYTALIRIDHYCAIGQFEEALDVLDGLDAGSKRPGKHLSTRVNVLWSWGKYKEARSLCDSLIDLMESNPHLGSNRRFEVMRKRAWISLDLHDTTQAIADLERVLELPKYLSHPHKRRGVQTWIDSLKALTEN